MTNSFNFFVVGDSDRPKDEIRVSKLATFPCEQSPCIDFFIEGVGVLVCGGVPKLGSLGACYPKNLRPLRLFWWLLRPHTQ
jgi:hypothetical protein